MDDVAEEILAFTLSSGPIQSLYLNEDRVNENFTTQLGAVAILVGSAGKQGVGTLNFKIVEVSKQKKAGNEIQCDLRDPLARALAPRTALQSENLTKTPNNAAVGQYFVGSGLPCLRSPDLGSFYPIDRQYIPDAGPRVQELERDRAASEAIRIALAGPTATSDRMWLLTLADGDQIVVASLLNTRWIDDSVINYISTMFRWHISGILRQRISGVPSLAAIHVWIELDEEVPGATTSG
jgi:hypothetical protein